MSILKYSDKIIDKIYDVSKHYSVYTMTCQKLRVGCILSCISVGELLQPGRGIVSIDNQKTSEKMLYNFISTAAHIFLIPVDTESHLRVDLVVQMLGNDHIGKRCNTRFFRSLQIFFKPILDNLGSMTRGSQNYMDISI